VQINKAKSTQMKSKTNSVCTLLYSKIKKDIKIEKKNSCKSGIAKFKLSPQRQKIDGKINAINK